MSFKEDLYAYCHVLVDERIKRAHQLIEEAQIAANSESKSSVGDKYETGRAMMMLEREKAESQLQEALKLKKVLTQINPGKTAKQVMLGSLIITSMGSYYLSVSLGKVTVCDQDVFVLSPVSPIGNLLMGKREGDNVSFNSRQIQIREIK